MKIVMLINSSKRIHISREELIKEIVNHNHDLVILGPKYETGLNHEDECRKNLAHLGVRFVGVEFDRIGMNVFCEIKSIIDVFKIIKKESPDLIIGIGLKMALYSGISGVLARVKKISYVINGRGCLFQIHGVKGIVLKAILFPFMKNIFNRSNVVIFQNPDDLNFFTEKKLLNGENGRVVYGSGVNLARFTEAEPPLKPVFLLVARLIWAKGIKEYIDAAIIVKNKYPEAKFLLIGPFDKAINAIKEEDIKEYIDQGIIEYKGEEKNVIKYYEACSCYVLPSFYGEGVPRTILEAMATGRPIITTNTPGCKETINNNKNGFLIPPKESKILAEKMCWMIENYEQSKIMGKESRKYCEVKFDVNIINKTMIELMGI